jgi:hypothetical protein
MSHAHILEYRHVAIRATKKFVSAMGYVGIQENMSTEALVPTKLPGLQGTAQT